MFGHSGCRGGVLCDGEGGLHVLGLGAETAGDGGHGHSLERELLERGDAVAAGERFALVIFDELLDDAFGGGFVGVDDVDGDRAQSCLAGGEGAALTGAHQDVAVLVASGQNGRENAVLADRPHELGRDGCAGAHVRLDDEGLGVDLLDGAEVVGGGVHQVLSP